MKYLIIYRMWVIQFHMNNSTHAIPQKTFGWKNLFEQMQVCEKKIVEIIFLKCAKNWVINYVSKIHFMHFSKHSMEWKKLPQK